MTWQEEARRLLESRGEMKAREAAHLIRGVCVEHGISTTLLLSPCRLPEVVAVRRACAEKLFVSGMTPADIGIVLGRHRGSIMSLLKRLRRQRLRSVEVA